MITEQLLTGAAIAGAVDDLATLRLEIFPEYPYLYQGKRADEITTHFIWREIDGVKRDHPMQFRSKELV